MSIKTSARDSWCACSCHLQKALKSPAALERVIGNLRLSYSGLYWLPTCNISSCQANSQILQVSEASVAPTGLVHGAVSSLLRSQAFGSILVGLKPPRPVPRNDALFYYA